MKKRVKILSFVLSAVLLASCSVSESKSDSSKADSTASASNSRSDYKYGKIDIPGKDGALCGAPIYIA